MKLTDEQLQSARKLASSTKPCRTCGGGDLIVGATVFALVSFEPDADEEPGQAPVLVVVCRSCKVLTLLEAHALGLLPDGASLLS